MRLSGKKISVLLLCIIMIFGAASPAKASSLPELGPGNVTEAAEQTQTEDGSLEPQTQAQALTETEAEPVSEEPAAEEPEADEEPSLPEGLSVEAYLAVKQSVMNNAAVDVYADNTGTPSGTEDIEAGVLLADLAAACTERGMFYPPDPGQRFAAVGGNVATNAGGMRAVKYGCTREYVRTLKVVLPDGRVVKLGGEPSKNSSGYSLLHLMVGSEGTLGIITEIGLKLIPQPKFQVSLLGMFEDLEACIHCVPAIKGSGLNPQSLEFMPRSNVVRAEKFMEKVVYPAKSEGTDVGAYLLTTFDCRREEEMDEIMEAAAEVMLEGGALDVIVFDNANAMKAAWDVRRAVPEAILATYDKVEECDIVVPTSYIAEVVEYALSLSDEVGLDIHTYGHAGDGNIHIKLCANGMEEQEFRVRSDKFLDLIYARGKGMNALISGEHGIGAVSVRRLEDYVGTDVMDLMRGIKAVFDPKGLLNPGKVCTYVKD